MVRRDGPEVKPFQYDLVPQTDGGLDIGADGRRFGTIRCRELVVDKIANPALAHSLDLALDDPALPPTLRAVLVAFRSTLS